MLVLGVKGAPGATTTALLLAGCLDGSLLVDADIDGGVLAVRHGLTREPGLSTLAADRSTGPEAVEQHFQEIGDVRVLVGPDHPGRAMSLWDRAGATLIERLGGCQRPVVIDGGRVRSSHALDLLQADAGLAVVVVRSDSEGLVAATNLPEDLDASLVVVESGPHEAAEISEASKRTVIGTLPFDHRTASAVNGATVTWSRRGSARSPLGRGAQTLARAVSGECDKRDRLR